MGEMTIDVTRTDAFRQSTDKVHKKMAGVTVPTFRCKTCGQTKSTTGRKQVVPGSPKFGYNCDCCANDVTP